jgi:hypothetical protein
LLAFCRLQFRIRPALSKADWDENPLENVQLWTGAGMRECDKLGAKLLALRDSKKSSRQDQDEAICVEATAPEGVRK